MQTIRPHQIDYGGLQLKVGLEVHQQLSCRTKLFCDCPSFTESSVVVGPSGKTDRTFDKKREFPKEFERILRPTTSELGELDEAAKFESRRPIRVRYLADSSFSCLVEADEEPPHPLNPEALDTSIIFSLALNSRIIDEIHVMRKLVVDGSNTSGFQRTAVVALGGVLTYNSGKSTVPVQSISLEEDAARAVNVEESIDRADRPFEVKSYALDRLGTPLVEVALAPIEGSPEAVENAAKTLGRMMRSTGRVARGLGTIRQDLNMSVMDGKVIEVKGVQKLEQVSRVIQFEALRQKFFFDLGKEIEEKIGINLEVFSKDVTDFFVNTKSTAISRALKQQENTKVTCVVVEKFAGFFAKENEYHARLGKELGAIARTYGLGGVLHSDELPNYGLTIDDVQSLRKKLDLQEIDGFVLISGPIEKVERAQEAITLRIKHTVFGVPAETRSATTDGETTFLRPRPGAARMYPETDIPLIQIPRGMIEKLRTEIPEPWEKQIQTFAVIYDIPVQLAEPLYDSDRKQAFEDSVKATQLPPRYLASIFVDILQNLSREGVPIDSLSNDLLQQALIALNEGRFAKEATTAVLRELSASPESSIEKVLLKMGLAAIAHDDLRKIIHKVIDENVDLIKAKGISSEKALMGKVMQQVRGKIDGKIVRKTLMEELADYLATEKIKH